VWLLPIEPFEERYTADWMRWWPDDLRADGWEVEVVMGGPPPGERQGGEWLDPTATWQWKGRQVAQLAASWADVRDGDVVLALDGWGPATTAALYMRATTGKRVHVVGFHHAGCWDPHDFLPRRGMAPWGLHVERGWAVGSDLLLVGSHHAAGLIRQHLTPQARLAVVGVPVKADGLQAHRTPWHQRPPLVVFPHRLAPEKDPDAWEALVATYRQRYGDTAQFVRSRDVYSDKASLYDLLGRARVVVSTAWQETFGIVMQEAVALGAQPLAPRRLSYPEVMRGQGGLYDSISDAADQLHQLLRRVEPAAWDGWHEDAVLRASAAIREVING
jgi:glycosyltransferase involved in cell wall biosynthesis